MGRIAGTAETREGFTHTSEARFRDPKGRVSGSSTTRCQPSGTCTTTYRDPSGRVMQSSTGKKPIAPLRAPTPPIK
jgi:hypothetical protein